MFVGYKMTEVLFNIHKNINKLRNIPYPLRVEPTRNDDRLFCELYLQIANCEVPPTGTGS